MTREELEQKWDRVTGVPLLVLAFVFLAFYAAPIINPDLDPALVAFLDVSQTVIWALFIIDFIGRFTLAEKKLPFLKRNVIELIAVVLPFFRPLRALRLLSVATIGFRRFGGKLRERVTFYVFGAAFMLWFITGLAVTEAERGVEGANIANIWQGWWWSFITMATVGYGDKFPITPEGQWVAVIIVLTGIALLGTISAFLASWFIDNVEKVETEILEDTVKANQTISELLTEVQSLRKEVQKLSKQVSSKD
jgi:voltage-gated potassium channel